MCKEHHHCSHHQAQECGHCRHEHGSARLPLRIGAAVLLFAAAVSGLLPPAAGTALFVAAWFVAGADIVYAAGRNILRGKWLDENALTRAGHQAICQALRDRDEAAVAAAIYDHLTLTGPYRECLIEQDAEDEKARRSQEDSL